MNVSDSGCLLHQGIARRGKLKECLAVAAGIGVHSLGRALEGAMNLRRVQALIQRQTEQFPVMLILSQRLANDALTPAEARR